MKGAYRVIIQNKRIRYDFEIKRNITVIRGDSATGKTTLIEMVQEYYRNGTSSAIELVCEKKCVTILSPAWKYELSAIYGTLKRTYNHVYHIYNKEDFDIQAKTEINIILTEDSYFSWERFFNSLLQRLTQDSYLQYNKKHLNTNYLSDKSMDKMLNVMRLGIEI